MELERGEKVTKVPLDKKKMILLSVIALIAVILVVSVSVSAAILSTNNIYKGVYIGDIHVGGMNAEKVKKVIQDKYEIDSSKKLTLLSGEHKTDVSVADLAPEIDVDAIVDKALQPGRQGNVFARLGAIHNLKKSTHKIPVQLQLNEEVLEKKVSEIANKVDIPEKELSVKIEDTKMVVTKGHNGKRIQMNTAKEKVKEAIFGKGDKPIELVLETVMPKELSAETLYNDYCGEPVNASYKIENQKLIIVDEKMGVSFDKSEADKLIRQANGDTVVIPITTKKAGVTSAQVKASLFPDLLASYTSKYNEADKERSHNIRKATNSINGVVLAPNDVFSYNNTLGPRTYERGYQMAKVYVGNQVEPGLGGGICQVSSTLFNTVVLSDLAITARTSHSMPVAYVPAGRDATVDYGNIDFKFTNSTDAPVKIVASAVNGVNNVKIYGVKKDPTKTIELTTERVSVTPADVVRKQDPAIEEGTVKVEHKGSDGCVYNTYKVTKINGSVVKSEFLTKSAYMTVNRVEIVGTKPKQDTVQTVTNPVEQTAEPTARPAMTPVPPASSGTSTSPTNAPTAKPVQTTVPTQSASPNAEQ